MYIFHLDQSQNQSQFNKKPTKNPTTMPNKSLCIIVGTLFPLVSRAQLLVPSLSDILSAHTISKERDQNDVDQNYDKKILKTRYYYCN